MSNNDDQLKRELEIIDSVADKGALGKAKAYLKLSGPGWLQGAITLGGGSLAGALYLGTISGYKLMWLQPLAMICGIIMLSAIAYVTLSTGQRPFGAINRNLSPLLGWSWLIATVMANIVWCMPQFNLGRAAVQQNLLPSVGESNTSTFVICLILLLIAFVVNCSYENGSKGLKTFERILKSMVGIIVGCFILVVVTLSINGAIPWGQIFNGLIPNFSYLFNAAPAYEELINSSSAPDFWKSTIANGQRDIIIAAFGTAVGINMTFLLPYSMIRKSWGAKHRGLAIFDLSIGLFVPFVIATACVVIASASQFHSKTADILEEDGKPNAKVAGAYYKGLAKHPKLDLAKDAPKEQQEAAIDALPESDRRLGAMLVKRDNFALANSLSPLTGKPIAQIVFGLGVLGMALSTIIILMLINGFAFQELFGKPGNKTMYFIGCSVSGLAGLAGPFIWGNGEARAALAIPTSVIGGSLIPIAYFTFLLLMNSRSTLGDKMPRGGKRVVWNVLMIAATSIATFGSVWVLLGKSKAPGFAGGAATFGLIFLGILFVVGITSFISKEKKVAN
ncbi:MAG: divalent metal cation transporter [Akkermansiaceae bacterium]